MEMRRLLSLLTINTIYIGAIVCLSCLVGCSSSRHFRPDKKYSPEQLRSDYTIFRAVLEENHPGLYWYSTSDSMRHYFDRGFSMLNDSLTEPGFRKILSYVSSKINCGHTSVHYSKSYTRHLDTLRLRQFPLYLKIWDDTAVVYNNLFKKDSLFKKGTLIKEIDQKPISYYRDSIFQFLSTDGYNTAHKYQTLSNRGAFGAWLRNIFGLPDSLFIKYEDSSGTEKTTWLPVYLPKKDSISARNLPPLTKKEKRQLNIPAINNIKIDSVGKVALLTVNSFGSGLRFKSFAHRGFRKLRQLGIRHLIIDVRNNGGGEVGNSTLLTRYLVNQKFKLADSLYAINKKSRYGKYIGHNFRNRIFMTLIARKKKDGFYHFGYFERTWFKPHKRNHFNGKVLVLIGANSFSATTLFANSVKKEEGVLLIGEETGGGSYGNNAWLIPDVTLPISGIRFRLPMFRMVENSSYPKTGRGIFPDIEVKTTRNDIKYSRDPQLLRALELVRSSEANTSPSLP